MGWNQKLIFFSVHIQTHVNISWRDRSSTNELSPTEIQLNLAGLGFILGKKPKTIPNKKLKLKKPQVFTAESQAWTFHKTYAYAHCSTT